MWTRTIDDSVVDANGKVICFSTERFVNDICLGNCCFICGARPDQKVFNDEHVISEWLLRRYDLFSKKVTLPNDVTVPYAQYTVPCCAECNSLMGVEIEQPISEVIGGGISVINDFVSKGGLLKLFVWMGLIFLKTHLKDRTFRFYLDRRLGDDQIADEYEWELLHHIHSVVRCFYNDCQIEIEAIGSFLALPVKSQIPEERFDFGDLYLAQTMLLRLDDLAMLTVFNDSGAVMNFFWQKLERITGPVSGLQLREIMVELAYLNLHLKERPTFHSEFDLWNERYRVVGARPELNLRSMDRRVRGKLLYHALGNALPNISVVGRTNEDVVEAIKAGDLTLLFDDDGEFIGDSWTPL